MAQHTPILLSPELIPAKTFGQWVTRRARRRGVCSLKALAKHAGFSEATAARCFFADKPWNMRSSTAWGLSNALEYGGTNFNDWKYYSPETGERLPSTPPPSPPPPAVCHWGDWVEECSRAAGFLTKADLSRAVGVHRKTILRWFEQHRPPVASENLNRLAKALRLTTQELLLEVEVGGEAEPAPAVAAAALPAGVGLRSALAAQLAAYARRLDLPELLELVARGAVLARQANRKHVGDAGQGTGEGAGLTVPGVVEVEQRSHVQPAPPEATARAFGSSRVGGV